MGPEERSAGWWIFLTAIVQAVAYAGVVIVFLWATGGLDAGTAAIEAEAEPGAGAARYDAAVAARP